MRDDFTVFLQVFLHESVLGNPQSENPKSYHSMSIIVVQSAESEVCHRARLGTLSLYIASVFLFRICVYILLCAFV